MAVLAQHKATYPYSRAELVPANHMNASESITYLIRERAYRIGRSRPSLFRSEHLSLSTC